MDFTLSAEQRLFRDTVRAFTDDEIRPVARDMEASGAYPEQIVGKMRQMGLFGLTIPEEFGGMAADLVSYAIAAASWSVPPEVYWSLHGELNGLRTLSSAHVVTMSAKPMSLPPICTVTSDVPVVRALNCGGLVPSGTDSEPSMSVVSAPWQLMSWNEEGASAALTRDG